MFVPVPQFLDLGSQLGNLATALWKFEDARRVVRHVMQRCIGIAEYVAERDTPRCCANGSPAELSALVVEDEVRSAGNRSRGFPSPKRNILCPLQNNSGEA
jgi:hypothetical protein